MSDTTLVALVMRLQADRKELIEALTRVLAHFPTDHDMLEAGWTGREVDDACNAHEAARALLSRMKESDRA